jgi:WYL domain-containing protein
VSTRTVRNDVERLRILGYQVDSTTGTAGGYRLGAGRALPPLLLDDDKAVAVAVGLAAAASGSVTGIEETSLRALAKLQQTLPFRLRYRVDALRSATISAAGGGPTVDPDTLTVAATAIRDHQQLRFDYVAHDGQATTRRTEPHRLVYTGRRWYLLGWDVDRRDWRTFRADRIRPRLPTGPRFTPREPPEDPVAHVVRGAGSLAWRHPARVRFHAPVERLAEQLAPAGRGPGDHVAGHSRSRYARDDPRRAAARAVVQQTHTDTAPRGREVAGRASGHHAGPGPRLRLVTRSLPAPRVGAFAGGRCGDSKGIAGAQASWRRLSG